jgi:hypothetical protein
MASGTDYSRLDRALHKLSFGSAVLQAILADLEASLYADSWKDVPLFRPVFITSLPRAGTTIILQALHQLPEVATHTYRDMPFIFTPVLWNKFSSGIRSKGVARERAHGDGLFISEDSPEAFEEVLWRKYFPLNYTDRGIGIWQSGSDEFADYFCTHMQKIVSLRCHDQPGSRYVSKNNGNIARTSAIMEMFPDAKIVVPLRDPIEHAISMWRQHLNFLDLQTRDQFVGQYMADVGHYEFGGLHRPIQFPGLAPGIEGLSTGSLDYWIAYWIAAFEFLSEQANVCFLSYERLCERPAEEFPRLCKQLELNLTTEEIAAAACVFRAAPAARMKEHVAGQELIDRSNNVYKKLLARCLLSR